MDKARYTAVCALMRQEKNGYSNLVLDGMLEKSQLPPRDRAFASMLFYGTLEHLLTLDACLSACLQKPLTKLDPQVRAVLRCGLYQIKYTDVPASAAVNESVNLTKNLGKTSASGLVNAVLRRAGNVQLGPFADEVERLSVTCSVSRPVAALLKKHYPSQAEQIMAAFARQAPTALRVNTLKTTPAALIAQLKQEGAEAVEGPVPGSLLAKFEGSPAATKAFARGLYHVQGLASRLAALSLDARPGQKVLDLCAAPGGKTVTLAQCMNNEGRLYSCDVAINRLQLIFHSLERCHITNTIVTRQDAAQHNPELCEADRVLCDVPCSGLGILAKKPDIRYKTLEGLEELCALQAKILRTAAGYVKPGGRLVYSTCTINPMENEEIIRAFLNEQPGWHLVPPWMTPPTARVSNGGMTLLPDGEGMDGFFIAVLEKD